jgi:hypothetical protein
MFCRLSNRVSMGFEGHTERTGADLVSRTYFPVPGVRAALGRTFTLEDLYRHLAATRVETRNDQRAGQFLVIDHARRPSEGVTPSRD